MEELVQAGARRLPVLTEEDLELPRKWIGGGGFGEIYYSKWKVPVALKLQRGNRETEDKLLKEAYLMERAQFLYVLRLLALYRNPLGEGVEYGLVMPYMPNGSLLTLFGKVSPVPWPLKFRILDQVALGMDYLHGLSPPLLHLDLKTSNVLLDESLTVQLADFGLSKVSDATSSHGAGAGGTVAYMPPEAFKGSHKEKSFDVYSYGILTWAVITEKEPYMGREHCNIIFTISKGQRPEENDLKSLSGVRMVPEAIALMRRCWDQDPAARPTFPECVKETSRMLEDYEDKITIAVRTVQDRLKVIAAEGNETPTSRNLPESTKPYKISDMVNPSFFKTKHEPTPTSEPSPVTPASPPGVVNPGIASPTTVTSATAPETKTQFLKKNWSSIINAITELQPILVDLKRDGILSKEECLNILANASVAEQSRVMLGYITKKGEYSSNRLYRLLEEAIPTVSKTWQHN